MITATLQTLTRMWHDRHILLAIIREELRRRYAGSLFGELWVVLQPALLLGIYLFVYMVVFKMRFPGYSHLDYVIFVFTGLVPYLGLWDSISTGALCVKQNLHLVRNVIVPIEFLPVQTVAASMASQMVSTLILILLLVINGNLSWWLPLLPLVMLLQFMFMVGLIWFLSSLAVIFSDLVYFVNLFMLLLLFVSPIGFKPEMVPSSLQVVLYMNPVNYLISMYREIMIAGHHPRLLTVCVYLAMCLATFVAGCGLFAKLKGTLLDYE